VGLLGQNAAQVEEFSRRESLPLSEVEGRRKNTAHSLP